MNEVSIKISEYVKLFFNYIYEITYIFYKPKKYSKKILNLSNKEILKRIIFYYFISIFMIFLLEKLLYLNERITYKFIFVYIILDVIVSLPNIIIVSISLKIVKIKNPIKKATFFYFICRTILIIVPFIFYLLFIKFEDYLFCILRFIFYLPLIFAFFLGPGLIFGDKIKQKILVIFLVIIFCLIVSPIYNQFPNEYSIFHDPIAAEFLVLKKDLSFYLEDNLESYLKILNEYYKEIKTTNKYKRIYFFDKYNFNEYFNQFYPIINDNEKVKKIESKINFNKNKEIIVCFNNYLGDLKKSEIEFKNIFNEIKFGSDKELILNFMESYISVYRQQNKMLTKKIKLLDKIGEYMEMISKLSSYGIITF